MATRGIIAGILAATVTPAAVATSVVWDNFLESQLGAVVGYLALGALAFAVIISLPAFFALRRFRLLNLWSMMACGFIALAIASFVAATTWSDVLWSDGQVDVLTVISFALLGAFSGLAFWCAQRTVEWMHEK